VDLALPRARILPYGVPHQPFEESQLEGAAWLLFPPERDAEGKETGRHRLIRGTDVRPPGPIVVLDATWGQARRMSHRIASLDALPRYQLEPGPAPPRRLRKPPRPGAVSTIEGVARLIELFDDAETARRLLELYDTWGRRARVVRPDEG